MGKWDCPLWTVICYIEVHFKAGLTVPWYLLHILRNQLKGVRHENGSLEWTLYIGLTAYVIIHKSVHEEIPVILDSHEV
jgi:hypothetical protein